MILISDIPKYFTFIFELISKYFAFISNLFRNISSLFRISLYFGITTTLFHFILESQRLYFSFVLHYLCYFVCATYLCSQICAENLCCNFCAAYLSSSYFSWPNLCCTFVLQNLWCIICVAILVLHHFCVTSFRLVNWRFLLIQEELRQDFYICMKLRISRFQLKFISTRTFVVQSTADSTNR